MNEEIKTLFDALTSKVEDMKASALKKEDLETVKTDLEALKGLEAKLTGEQTKQYEKLKEDINFIKDSLSFGDDGKKESLKSVLEANEDDFKKLKSNPSGSVSIEVKAATTMMVSTHTTGDVVRSTKDSGVTQEMNYKPTIWDDLRKVYTNAAEHHWVEKKPKEGGAAMTAEGASKPNKDFTFEAKSAVAKKVAVVEKASKEMLDDIDGMQNFINVDMRDSVSDVMQYQALMGDNTGENIQGIYGIAVPFNPYGKKVERPNVFDVIRLAIAQITIAGAKATSVALNPVDTVDLELLKDANGNYIMPPFTAADGTRIKGVRVIEDINMPVGEFIVYDRNKTEVRIREDINITAGWENDDFRKNLTMFVCEARLYNIIKEPYYPAFVKGVIADAIAAITPAPVTP